MKVVWSDEAVLALIALELTLAKRYSAEKTAKVVDAMVKRVDRLHDHPQLGRAVPEYGRRNFASSSTGGTESSTVSVPTRSRS